MKVQTDTKASRFRFETKAGLFFLRSAGPRWLQPATERNGRTGYWTFALVKWMDTWWWVAASRQFSATAPLGTRGTPRRTCRSMCKDEKTPDVKSRGGARCFALNPPLDNQSALVKKKFHALGHNKALAAIFFRVIKINQVTTFLRCGSDNHSHTSAPNMQFYQRRMTPA